MLFVVLGLSVTTRHHPEWLGSVRRDSLDSATAPLGVAASAPTSSSAVDGGSALASSLVDAAAVEQAAEAQQPPLMSRPIRAVATRWEVAAPALLAAGGVRSQDGSLFDSLHLRTELNVVRGAREVEEALARGGAEEGGADIAIIPLATWISSYEHLAALGTEVFFVAAWSRGSEAYFIAPNADPSRRLPATLALAGDRTSAETLSLLMLFGEADVDIHRLRFTSLDSSDAIVATVEREARDAELGARGRVPWMSTADASRISLWVMVAPRAFADAHTDAIVAWCRGWQRGVELLARDVPQAARTISGFEGAPPLVDVLRRLGQIAYVPLFEQAELAGLSGRSYLTLGTLFERAWDAERRIGVVTGPPPESMPIATFAIASIVRREAPSPPPLVASTRTSESTRVLMTFPFDVARSYRDAEKRERLVNRVAFIASVFARSPLRVSVPSRDLEHARIIIGSAVEQYGVDSARITVTSGQNSDLRVLFP